MHFFERIRPELSGLAWPFAASFWLFSASSGKQSCTASRSCQPAAERFIRMKPIEVDK